MCDTLPATLYPRCGGQGHACSRLLASPPMAPDQSPTDRVQMNVRVPRWLLEQIDARRALLADRHGVPFARDKWIENAAVKALRGTITPTSPQGRTAPPPHRRGTV